MAHGSTNTGWVCPEHAPKPDPHFAKLPVESFVGKFVKLCFVFESLGAEKREHMWVRTIRPEFHHCEHGTFELFGVLANDSSHLEGPMSGSPVWFARNEIEAVLTAEEVDGHQ